MQFLHQIAKAVLPYDPLLCGQHGWHDFPRDLQASIVALEEVASDVSACLVYDFKGHRVVGSPEAKTFGHAAKIVQIQIRFE